MSASAFPSPSERGNRSHQSADVSVVVVGAGPTGLMLAGELALGGADVVLVDRLDTPATESRGLGFTARAAEVFSMRGLLSGFTDPTTTTAGHFGGIRMDFSVLDGCHFGVRSTEQAETESVLTRWVEELGVAILRGQEVVALAEHDGIVDVTLRGPSGPWRLLTHWLVGCDGGRSTVRDLGGFSFPGEDATCEMFLADVVGAGIGVRPLGERVRGGMVMAADLPGGRQRVIVCERGRPARDRTNSAPGFDEVAQAWRSLTGEDISHGTPTWVSSFSDASRQAEQYRRGRVLLAGDAAHIHLPAGGQGLSIGVQDAINLGWKLAAVVVGDADEALLDTYHAERHPVGARVLMNTRAQGLLFLGGSEVDPLRGLLGDLLTQDAVGRHLAGMVSGFDVRYDVGPGDHALLGRRMPALPTDSPPGATFPIEQVHDGSWLLLTTAAHAPDIPVAHRSRTTVVDVARADTLAGADALLVRPDGHVAWTSPSGESLDDCFNRWFPRSAPANANAA